MTESGKFIAQFEKNSKEKVRVSVDEFHGRMLINLRVYYRDGDQWLPGKQGLALGVDRYRDLADALVKLGEELQSRGLLKPRNENVSIDSKGYLAKL